MSKRIQRSGFRIDYLRTKLFTLYWTQIHALLRNVIMPDQMELYRNLKTIEAILQNDY